MTSGAMTGHFLEGSLGQIFVLSRWPNVRPTGTVLIVPPFAEEMNKCRRMMTEASLGLVEHGYCTVLPDLFGTGDSTGEFQEATWDAWQNDLGVVARWMASRGHPPEAILAIRLGSALASSAVESGRLQSVKRSVLWQPVWDANRYLTQFLRLRVAASLAESRRETVAELRARLHAGETLEVAGYPLSGRLAADIDGIAAPAEFPEILGDVLWLEVVGSEGAPLSSAASTFASTGENRVPRISLKSSVGEPFWSSTEIVVNQSLVAQTVAYLALGHQAVGARDA